MSLFNMNEENVGLNKLLSYFKDTKYAEQCRLSYIWISLEMETKTSSS